MNEPWDSQMESLGAFIRDKRKLSNLSLRQLSALAEVSNPYLSQLERGLHEPSVRVLRSIAGALNMSAESLLQQAGLIRPDVSAVDVMRLAHGAVAGTEHDPDQAPRLLAIMMDGLRVMPGDRT